MGLLAVLPAGLDQAPFGFESDAESIRLSNLIDVQRRRAERAIARIHQLQGQVAETEARIAHRNLAQDLLQQADLKERELVNRCHDLFHLMQAEEKVIARMAPKVAERDVLVIRGQQLQTILASADPGITVDELLTAQSRLAALPDLVADKQAAIGPLENELVAVRAEMQRVAMTGPDSIDQLEHGVEHLRYQAEQPFGGDEPADPAAEQMKRWAATPNAALARTQWEQGLAKANADRRRWGLGDLTR